MTGIVFISLCAVILFLRHQNALLRAELAAGAEDRSAIYETRREVQLGDSAVERHRLAVQVKPLNTLSIVTASATLPELTPAPPNQEGLIQLKREEDDLKQQFQNLEADLFSMAKRLNVTPEILEHPDAAPAEFHDFVAALAQWKDQLISLETAKLRIQSEMVDLGMKAGDLTDSSGSTILR